MTEYRTTIEYALDHGQLWARMGSGKYWRLRRNGQTKLWARKPDEFRIPVKAGFRSTGYVDHDSRVGTGKLGNRPDFIISATDPNVKG